MAYITHEEYMKDSANLFWSYYAQVANVANISISDDLVKRSKIALAQGDDFLNTIPLKIWDRISLSSEGGIRIANTKINGKPSYTISDGVCAAKALAKEKALTT